MKVCLVEILHNMWGVTRRSPGEVAQISEMINSRSQYNDLSLQIWFYISGSRPMVPAVPLTYQSQLCQTWMPHFKAVRSTPWKTLQP